MMDLASESRVSIVIEWENALLAERDRALAMLGIVRRQATELAGRADVRGFLAGGRPMFEVLLVCDSGQSDRSELTALLEQWLGAPGDTLRWRIVSVADTGYYSKKHHGAMEAAGRIIAFVDSDTVPEPGWLEQILISLKDPGVQVVAGNTYIEPAGLVGKTFALTWFFPLRSADGEPRRDGSLFANNLAMRRDVYHRHPFPRIDGSSRGACLLLAEDLARNGVSVVHNPRARVAHPAPNGFLHVSKRALAQGRDRVLRERLAGNRMTASWLASIYRLLRHQAGAAWKICTGFSRVKLNPLMIPCAVAVAGYYYLLYWAGETLLQLRVPAVMRIRI